MDVCRAEYSRAADPQITPILEREKPWVRARIRDRLGALSTGLATPSDSIAHSARGPDDGSRIAQDESVRAVDEYPNLPALMARGEARPAYTRTLDDQLAVFTDERAKDLSRYVMDGSTGTIWRTVVEDPELPRYRAGLRPTRQHQRSQGDTQRQRLPQRCSQGLPPMPDTP